MSDQIVAWNVQDYKSTVALLLQQRGSRLKDAVMNQSFVGTGAKAVNQVGAVTAVKRTTRHGDTPLIESPMDARWCHPQDYEWADLIDDQDKLRLLADPNSAYAQNGAYALGRACDDEIINAFFATSVTGEAAAGTEAFAASQQVASGSTGMTVAKLRAAKQLLMAAEVDVDNDPLYCAITASQHDNLLSETQAISLDYTNKPALVDGRITAFMGFNFIHTERLLTNGSSETRCPVWAKSGMILGQWDDITTQISERADKSYATQVYVKGTFGATRTELEKVVEIPCA